MPHHMLQPIARGGGSCLTSKLGGAKLSKHLPVPPQTHPHTPSHTHAHTRTHTHTCTHTHARTQAALGLDARAGGLQETLDLERAARGALQAAGSVEALAVAELRAHLAVSAARACVRARVCVFS